MMYPAIFVQRFVEALASALPFVVMGLLLAAAVSVFVPAWRIRRLMATRENGQSRNPVTTPLIGALWGLVLPVCSVGAIPLLLVGRRAGASRRALAAFALTSGFLNPYTLVYALGQSAPWKVLLLVACGVAVAAIAGLAAGERAPRDAAPTEPIGRLAAVPWVAGQLLLSTVLICLLITAFAAATTAVALQPGFIGHLFTESDVLHVGLTAAIAIPAYVPPTLAALQAGEILWQRTDPGAALLWWMLGAGLSVGKLLFLPRVLGWSGLLRSGAVGIVLLLLAAVAISPVLRDGPVPDDDSHAFDRHNQPYHHAVEDIGALPWLGRQMGLLSTSDVHYSSLVLLLLMLTAAAPPRWTTWALKPRERTGGGLSARTLGAVAGVAAVCVLVSLLYTRYPSPSVTFATIRHADAELLSLVRTEKWDATSDPLRALESQVSLLGPGALMRTGIYPAGYGAALAEVRERSARLRTAISTAQVEPAMEASMALTHSLRHAQAIWEGRAPGSTTRP